MDTATRTHAKVECPFCAWSSRSFHLPGHLITHHASHVGVRYASSHCLYGEVRARDLQFTVCLTCHKGYMGDATSPQGSRWNNAHEKSKECAKAHPGALAAFRQAHASQSEPVDNNIRNVWNECKFNSVAKRVMEEIENDLREINEDDPLYVFDPAQGFKNMVKLCMGYKNKFEALQKKDREDTITNP